MAKRHFARDYQKLVKQLKRAMPHDEAMEKAVGGDYQRIGTVAATMLQECGLADGMSLLDFGCGSGRVARVVSERIDLDGYLGVDVVRDLIRHARGQTPDHYRFAVNESLSLPAGDAEFDFVCAFSVFTHLMLHETYVYLREMRRVLKPGGKVLFSFLELGAPDHLEVLRETADVAQAGYLEHLNAFMERGQIEIIAADLGFRLLRIIEPDAAFGAHGGLGQSACLLQKP
ncbi:MAG: class I SAM-dependent methyltransferase [Pseudomonadota bacterium]